jgi:hypothetical protein
MRDPMQLKNIVQIATLTSLIATGSAHAMQALLAKGAKATMRWTGNAMLVGYPLYNSYNTHKCIVGNEKTDDLRDPSEMEKQFLEQHITTKNKTIKIQTNTDARIRKHCEADGTYIILPETYDFISLEEALRTNNQNVLAHCAAIAQHKNEHAQNHHHEKFLAAITVAPILTTGLVAGITYTLYPYNKAASLTRHFVNMGKKSLGGLALGTYNQKLRQNLRYELEHKADQAITEKYKGHYAKDLVEVDKSLTYRIELLKRSFAMANIIGAKIPEEIIAKHAQLELEQELVHPSLNERLIRLPEGKPKNLAEQLERELKRLTT